MGQTDQPIEDDKGNRILYSQSSDSPRVDELNVLFSGKNNLLRIAEGVSLKHVRFMFHGDNGVIDIGGTRQGQKMTFIGLVRVGHSSTVQVGSDFSCSDWVFLTAVEGSTLVIGDDCMFSRGVQVRTHDTHGIYDVVTKKRVNTSESIYIGSHVWLAERVSVLGGSRIEDGSVIGIDSLVTGHIPNNAVAVGRPARVVRRNVAWERHSVYSAPPGMTDVFGGIKAPDYWRLTEDQESE